MLAYLFWHWPAAGVDAQRYEQGLTAFHQRLGQSDCRGLLATAGFRVQGLPWTGGATAYEDWYLLADSAALDALNAAAVSGARRAVHDDVAQQAGGGVGGLYHLVEGAGALDQPNCHWFTKPAGTRYAEFLPPLRSHLPPGASLWQRHLVLGPAPEFCLVTVAETTLPAGITALRAPRQRVCREDGPSWREATHR